ncbi:MAG: SMI1/KNR4 family protein [Peptococcaceae bacterium]|nr:SMI1/KNR4 family protein [Peptococcaceae bacterium]
MDFSKILGVIKVYQGAPKESIIALEASMNMAFPEDYKIFLRYSDGLYLENGVSLYSANEIIERNTTYEISDYCEGFLLIGDDSGGRGFLINVQKSGSKVYNSGFGDLNPPDFRTVANSFQEWVENGFVIPDYQTLNSDQIGQYKEPSLKCRNAEERLIRHGLKKTMTIM